MIWTLAFLLVAGLGLLGWAELSFMARFTNVVVVGVCSVLIVRWGMKRLRSNYERSE